MRNVIHQEQAIIHDPTRTFGGQEGFDIIVSGTGVELSSTFRELVTRKIGRVRQYAPRAFRARVQFEKELWKGSLERFRVMVRGAMRAVCCISPNPELLSVGSIRSRNPCSAVESTLTSPFSARSNRPRSPRSRMSGKISNKDRLRTSSAPSPVWLAIHRFQLWIKKSLFVVTTPYGAKLFIHASIARSCNCRWLICAWGSICSGD